MDPSQSNRDDLDSAAVEKSARKFGPDVRSLRERLGLSLSEVQARTRISKDILGEFEATGLITNPLFNRVYLRSLASSYATAIGVDQTSVLGALESALRGEYEGGLSDLLTEEHAEGSVVPDVEQEASAYVPGSDAEPGEEDADTGSRVGRRFEFVSLRGRSGDSKTGHADSESKTGRLHTEISTAVHDYRPPEDHRGLIVRPNRFRALALGTLVVVVSAAAIITAIRLTMTTQPPDDVSQPASVEPSVVSPVETLPPDPVPVAPPFTVGDSISVTIVASRGPLDPVRVQSDRDLRRPYWVDEGDSMRFRIGRRIVVQDLLDRLTLKIEGVPVPTGTFFDGERVVITRDSVQAFVQSLTGR